MVHECASQPWKGLYLGYEIVSTVFIRVPLWTLRYMWPFMRPYTSWTWDYAVKVELLRRLSFISSVVGGIIPMPDWRAIVPAAGVEGVWIEGVPQLVTAELKLWASVSNVTAERIPGYWYGKKGISPKPATPPKRGEKVFYCLHGGGFVQMSAHPKDYPANLTCDLVELDGSTPHALALEYRLSATRPLPDQNPFPAALLDALAGYHYLVNVMCYDPSNIILTGDSAGGNLALALTRYLVESKGCPNVSLPGPPGQLLLLSPWTDLGSSHDWPGSSTLANTKDYLVYHDAGRSLYSKLAYLGPYGLGFASFNRFISPASLHPCARTSFVGFPRTFVAVGSAERFLDPIRTLRDKMVADLGDKPQNGLTYYEAKDAIHDFLIFPWFPSRSVVLKTIQQWLVQY
ncbi:Alpha/Beta hydrolase protein [Phlebopus sp. FC_14]|nr:Alpha/Beta hydrolase protein [Phlebopus sp. FC_14]